MKPLIEDLLHGNGNIIDAARRKGKSLDSTERRRIDRVRTQAIDAGFNWSTINAFEMEGERGMRGSRAIPIAVEFRGLQCVDLLGMSTRLYNIRGDHPQNGSTVGVTVLVQNNILPVDISVFRIAVEVLKEQFVIATWWLISLWQRLKIKIGALS